MCKHPYKRYEFKKISTVSKWTTNYKWTNELIERKFDQFVFKISKNSGFIFGNRRCRPKLAFLVLSYVNSEFLSEDEENSHIRWQRNDWPLCDGSCLKFGYKSPFYLPLMCINKLFLSLCIENVSKNDIN